MSIHKKIDDAKRMLDRVCEFYPDKPGGLTLANSGGKDSLVCYSLLKEMGAQVPILHSNTTIDPPGTLKYIREYMPETVILNPKESFFQLVTRKAFPTRQNRFCCEILKERVGIGRNVIEGIRAAESSNRAGREPIVCDPRPSMKGTQHIYPIYTWSDEDVYGYIRMRGLELAPCYHQGLKRLGCVGCPQVSRKGVREAEFALYPRYYAANRRAIQKGMELHPTWKITRYTGGDPDKAMAWWLSNLPMYKYFGYDLPYIRSTKHTTI